MAAICNKPGCNLPKWVEARTRIEHKYCGRTHAIEVEGKIKDPHGSCHKCNLRGCANDVKFDSKTGRVHDFCCAVHADKAIERREWNPNGNSKRFKGSKRCKFPGCSELCFYDESRDLEYDFCGRAHATEYKIWAHEQNIMKVKQQQKNDVWHPMAPVPFARPIPVLPTSYSSSSAVSAPPINNVGGIPTIRTGLVKVKIHHSESTPFISSEPKPTILHSSQLNNRSIAAFGNPSVTHSCVVCADDTADTVLHPCGHLCVCYEHGVELKKSVTQNKCPLCAEPIGMLIKVKGISSTSAIAAAF
eukprot:gene5543-11165_t